MKQISMIKGEHRFIFRYRSGEELALLDCFTSLAQDKHSGFDWNDASVMSFQVSHILKNGALER